MRRRACVLAGMMLLITVPSAFGLITATLPLSKFLDDAKFICTVKVETIDTEKLGAVLVVEDDLKGKLPVRRLLLNLKGDSEAKKYDHTKQLLKRLAPRMTIVLFVGEDKGQYSAFAYSNGTWFHMIATKAADVPKTVFAFTHCEPYLRKTFKGTTEELKAVLSDVVAGIAKAPDADPKEPPGLGPEAEK
jgi:hypothetical protein